MKKIITIQKMKNEINSLRKQNKSIGFVPTMGFLHEGHLSLMRRAKKENDVVVISIFVNPTQFGPKEDFATYPQDIERDMQLAESVGVGIVFNPSVEEMYPHSYATYVDVEGEITNKLCGQSRPGHFKGVATIVTKLFNIVMADSAYFGQKDAQQVAVISQMVRDLNININIVPCSIVREDDGLAMSSRNTYLTQQERKDATVLSKSLFEAEQIIKDGEIDAFKVKELIIKNINTVQTATIDYVEVVNAITLQEVEEIKGDILIALAVKIGKTRLIDNIRLEVL